LAKEQINCFQLKIQFRYWDLTYLIFGVTKRSRMSTIKFTNAMFFNIKNNSSLQKIIKTKGFDTKTKFKIFSFIREITESSKIKAFEDSMKEIIGEKENVTLNDPEIMNLFTMESDFEIEKLKLYVDSLPEEITVEDMFQISWLIELEEKE